MKKGIDYEKGLDCSYCLRRPVLCIWFACIQNMVTLDENVNLTTAEIQVQLRRQAQLLPNLAATVQSSANFEQDTFKGGCRSPLISVICF